MKGTAILFHDDLSVTFLENIDLDTWKKSDEKNLTTKSIETHSDQSSHEQLLFIEEDVDWEYGY
ncbi:hypothetical protein KGR20_04085 [Cytobacillus oceanisediminis]|uniref:Uncharacterized protein n=1 Tax=Niallia alba TaxID=2729105 RepID=A0A7Y0PN60_9BACI|nr:MULTISPECIES: hypothetical protein [Bacillaceae]EOR26905.1 hypothetical protein A499_00890 [Niallia nealsonii AAU1]MBQ6447704.1 hypothetical protein [Bacillus sp. (in: firmicutes)]MDU1845330.1 hypothetical protein [Niallia nealsonii]MBZ9533438.1 hypothetical protein [Cytobacillus oceanisediminis]MED3795545.1 hypothetical protein [Niallia alba]